MILAKLRSRRRLSQVIGLGGIVLCAPLAAYSETPLQSEIGRVLESVTSVRDISALLVADWVQKIGKSLLEHIPLFDPKTGDEILSQGEKDRLRERLAVGSIIVSGWDQASLPYVYGPIERSSFFRMIVPLSPRVQLSCGTEASIAHFMVHIPQIDSHVVATDISDTEEDPRLETHASLAEVQYLQHYCGSRPDGGLNYEQKTLLHLYDRGDLEKFSSLAIVRTPDPEVVDRLSAVDFHANDSFLLKFRGFVSAAEEIVGSAESTMAHRATDQYSTAYRRLTAIQRVSPAMTYLLEAAVQDRSVRKSSSDDLDELMDEWKRYNRLAQKYSHVSQDLWSAISHVSYRN